MHKTRSKISKLWPVPRKGNRYIVAASHNQAEGIPVLVVLRDVLKLGKTRKEIKRIILLEKIKVNGNLVKDEKFPIVLMDILSIDNKDYKMNIANGKFKLEETKEHEKTAKIIGKKILSKGRVQINLGDGRNFISKDKLVVGDSVVFNFKENKISKVLELKDGANIVVISGSHIGEQGKIEKVAGMAADVKLGKEKVNLRLNSLMAV